MTFNLNLILTIIAGIILVVILLKIITNGYNSKPKSARNAPPERNAPSATDWHSDAGKKIMAQEEQDIVVSGYKDIMKTAHKHAKNLLYETTIAASNMLKGTKQTNEHLEEQLDKILQGIAASDIQNLKKSTEGFDKHYQEALRNIQDQMHKAALEMLENTQAAYNEKLNDFARELLKNGTNIQSLVNAKTTELLGKADSEVAQYKKQRLDNAADEVGQLVQKVFRDILKVSIPETVHEELIVKSLEDAKKEGLFKL